MAKINGLFFNFSNLCTIFAAQFIEKAYLATAPVTTMGVTGFDSR